MRSKGAVTWPQAALGIAGEVAETAFWMFAVYLVAKWLGAL